jgi:hypothetical protein
LMASLLYGVGPRDPVMFVDVACLLFALAVAATGIPAVLAELIDPIIALRGE